MASTLSLAKAGVFDPHDGFSADIRANNFDVIRLGLALLVIYSHSFPGLGFADHEPLTVLSRGQGTLGGIAVTWFFTISGFLITRSWVGSPDLRDYLSKRVRRIYPGFIVTCLICLFVVGPLGAASRLTYWKDLDPIRFPVRMLLLDPRFPQTFQGLPIGGVNGALWTIRWEFLCYLCVPVVAVLGCLRRRSWLLALFVASMALLVIKTYFAPGIMFPGRLITAFMAGQVFYLYIDRIRFRRIFFACSGALLLFSALAGSLQLFHIFMPVFGGYLLFHVAFARSRILRSIKSFIGGNDLSYGVYLYGWPAEQLVLQATHQRLGPHGLFVLTAAASIILGALSWFLVERRFLPHRSGRTVRVAPSATPAAAGLSATPVTVDGPTR